MNDEKIIKLNIKKDENIEPKSDNSYFGSFHTNPIIKKMLLINEKYKSKKFTFQDLFR